MAIPISNVVLQQSPTTMTTLPENQSMRFENDFRLADPSMSEAEIYHNAYLNLYNEDLSPFETSINGGYETEFYCPNETMPFCAPSTYNNLSPSAPAPTPTFYCPNYSYETMSFCAPSTYNNLSPPAPAPAPAFYCPNYSYETMLFCAPSTYNNLSPLAPAPAPAPTPTPTPTPMENSGFLSDVVNFCSNNQMHRVAANNGRVGQSSRMRIIWTVDEHKLFLVGMAIFGSGNWKSIANKVVLTKTHTQVASHAQKFFTRQQIPKEQRKRKSIHDIDTVDPELLSEVYARLESQPETRTRSRPRPRPRPPPTPPLPSLTNYSPLRMDPDPTQPYEQFNNYVPNVEQLPLPSQPEFVHNQNVNY